MLNLNSRRQEMLFSPVKTIGHHLNNCICLYFFTTFFLNKLFTYVTVTWGSYKSLRSIICFTMQDMFSQEEGTWSCQKSFCFLLGELLTGI